MSPARKFRIFLAALSIIGSLFVYLATSHYGPGVSTDAARYMSTAESIASGGGVVDYLGQSLVNWPPLYPAILALFSLAGADVFIVGQVINILAFGGIIWLSGILFERNLKGNYSFAAIASLIVATSLPLIEVSANISSDPLFMISVLFFLLTAQRYAAKPSRSAFWQLAALAAVSCFLRYAGFALILSGAGIVFLVYRRDWRRAFMEAASFCLASGLPIAAWAVLFNYRQTGAILGSHLPAYPWGLFSAAVSKVSSWFVPESLLNFVPPLALLGLVLALLAVRSNRKRWAALVQRVLSVSILPSAVFFAVYGLMLVFAISYPEHRVAGSQRIHAVLLPMLIILAAVTWQVFAPPPTKKLASLWRKVGLAIFALWLLFPLYRVAVYVRTSMAEGDISYYNLYNTRTLRESDVVAQIQSLDLPAEQRVYSNNEGAAYFYMRRHIYRLPRYDAELGEDLETAMLTFEGWPDPDEDALLIWFKRDLDYKETVPTPEEMQQYIQLVQEWAGRYGLLYRMDVELGQ